MTDSLSPRLVFIRSDLAETPVPVIGPPVEFLLVAQSAADPQQPLNDPGEQVYYDYMVAKRGEDDSTYRFSRRHMSPWPEPCANGHGPAPTLYGNSANGPWYCGDCLTLSIGDAAELG